jgi:hypothetical protein
MNAILDYLETGDRQALADHLFSRSEWTPLREQLPRPASCEPPAEVTAMALETMRRLGLPIPARYLEGAAA